MYPLYDLLKLLYYDVGEIGSFLEDLVFKNMNFCCTIKCNCRWILFRVSIEKRRKGRRLLWFLEAILLDF